MNVRKFFIVIFTLCLTIANSQVKTLFSTINYKTDPIRFTPEKIEVTKIMSLNMLSKILVSDRWDEDYNTCIFTKNFNWAAAAFRNESYKRMFYNPYKHDRFGREYFTDLNEGIINQIYFKDANFSY